MPDRILEAHADSTWLQLYQSVTDNPHAVHGIFQQDHAVHDEPSSEGPVQKSDAVGATSEYAPSSETLALCYGEANGDVLVDPRPRKGTKKRERDRNWTEEETSVLVACKRLAFLDKASPFRKQASSATNWEAISDELRSNFNARASEKTGDQCRLRWDTLVKSHRLIRQRCLDTTKGFTELTEEEMNGLKLATTLNAEWFEVIDTISRKSRTPKRDNTPRCECDFGNEEGGLGNGVDPAFPGLPPSAPCPPPQFLDWPPSASALNSPPRSPPLFFSTGRAQPPPSKPSATQIAIPGFSKLSDRLRSTVLDLTLGRRVLRNRFTLRIAPYHRVDRMFKEPPKMWRFKHPSLLCSWLSIVQNRRFSDVYDDVCTLVKKGLVHLSVDDDFAGFVDLSYFRVFDKFVKKVIRIHPNCDTHSHFKFWDKSEFIPSHEIVVPQRIRVLYLDRCNELKQVHCRGLGRLRSLFIIRCLQLERVTEWKFLRDLQWLEIQDCPLYYDYPNFQNLPSLKEFRFDRRVILYSPLRSDLGISQCVRLRRLEIRNDRVLEGSGDLSSLKCLETLSFYKCRALSSITGLSGLHALSFLDVRQCLALHRLPDLSHMKELAYIDIRETRLEEIPGVEKLVSLELLRCRDSHLKHLPDLHHLPALQKVWLAGTPLIEDDPSSFYFDKPKVLFRREESTWVDVSDVSDTEHRLSDTSGESDEDEGGDSS